MIMVSVVMITYGHEKYIEDAINGVLSQECNFEFELILSNDASPDNTHEIIKNILSTHPRGKIVKYTKHDRNLGMMQNSLYVLNKARGKYIATCEGDDFWTDNKKLQIQVDFLESNPDYVMAFHDVDILPIDDKDNFEYPIPALDTLYLKDIIRTHYIATCSLIYRSSCFPNGYPEWMANSISGDIPLEIMLAAKGKARYFRRKLACYRRNIGGISQSDEQLSRMRSGYIYMYAKILREVGIIDGYYLIFKLTRLIAGGIRNSIVNKINFV